MKPSEAAAVLARAALYDRRTVGEIEARAWSHALGDHELSDALTAVDEHYGESDRWIMPVHVNDRATTIARRRIGRVKRAQLDAEIAAENGGSLPGDSPRELDGPPDEAVAAAVALAKRVPGPGKRPADALRESVAAYAREQVANAERDDPELAARLRQARAEARAELDALRRRDEPRAAADV